MPLPAIPVETLQANLAAARAAYHALMTGTQARVVVDTDGTRVEFTATNSSRLYAYIQALEAKLCPVVAPTNGPLGFLF